MNKNQMNNWISQGRLHHWAWDMGAVLFGCLYPLAFAPFEWRPLAWLSLGFLFIAVHTPSAKLAFLRAWLWGMGAFIVGVSWVYNSMTEFGGASPLAGSALTVLFAIYLALHTGLAGYLWHKAVAKDGRLWVHAMGFTLIWLVMEWVRGTWTLGGFPWLMLGVAQLDTVYQAWLPLGGALFTAAVMLLTLTLGLGYLLEQRWRASAAVMLISLSSAWGLSFLDWKSESPQEVDVALVQGNIPQELKLRSEKLGLSLNTYRELSHPHYDADLIIWPETAVPTYRQYVGDFLTRVENESKPNGATVFTGIFLAAQNGTDYYNAMLEVGGEEQVYIKHQLVPFGEYTPMKWLMGFFSAIVEIPKADMASAPLNTEPLLLGGVKASASICYEMGYPDVLRAQLPAATLMINTSNDAWFGDSFAPHQHLEMVRARAKEFARPVARATNNGLTGFVDMDGTILGLSEQFGSNVIRKVIQTNDVATPFTYIGQHAIGIVLTLFFILLSVLSRKTKSTHE